MQPSLPVALPAQATTTPLIGKLQPGPADFGGALATLLAAVVPTPTTNVQQQLPVTMPTSGSPPQEAQSCEQHTSDLLVAMEAPPAATALPQIPEVPVASSQPQTNAAAVRSRPSSAPRREPAPSPVCEVQPSDPAIIAQAQPAAPIIALPNIDVSSPATTAPPPEHGETAAAHKSIDMAKPEPPQPTPAQPSDVRPAIDESVPTLNHEPVAVPNSVAAPAATQSATITVAVPASPVTPTITPASPAAPATPPVPTTTPHPTPVAQIAPALISLGHAPDGAQRLTMKLEPPDLGQVQVRIDRPTTDAPARVAITVEKAETLTLLLRDQPQLQRALDQAGVPSEGRSITFHVGTLTPATRTDTATAPLPSGPLASMNSDLSHGTPRQSGRPTQPDTVSTDDTEEVDAISAPEPMWLRAGLDITA